MIRTYNWLEPKSINISRQVVENLSSVLEILLRNKSPLLQLYRRAEAGKSPLLQLYGRAGGAWKGPASACGQEFSTVNHSSSLLMIHRCCGFWNWRSAATIKTASYSIPNIRRQICASWLFRHLPVKSNFYLNFWGIQISGNHSNYHGIQRWQIEKNSQLGHEAQLRNCNSLKRSYFMKDIIYHHMNRKVQ